MNREIKFRGKRFDNGKWVYGHYFMGVPSPLDENKQRHYIAPPCGLGEEVDPATVGQFTGLKDKNGQEIYEDDIAKVKISTFIDDAISNEEEIFELVKPVIYRGCAFVVDISELGTEIDYELIENFCGNVGEEFGHSFEVIGNIYDNPELLEVK
jgi:uncharacterized phage protein (TIGR01671 family)